MDFLNEEEFEAALDTIERLARENERQKAEIDRLNAEIEQLKNKSM